MFQWKRKCDGKERERGHYKWMNGWFRETIVKDCKFMPDLGCDLTSSSLEMDNMKVRLWERLVLSREKTPKNGSPTASPSPLVLHAWSTSCSALSFHLLSLTWITLKKQGFLLQRRRIGLYLRSAWWQWQLLRWKSVNGNQRDMERIWAASISFQPWMSPCIRWPYSQVISRALFRIWFMKRRGRPNKNNNKWIWNLTVVSVFLIFLPQRDWVKRFIYQIPSS